MLTAITCTLELGENLPTHKMTAFHPQVWLQTTNETSTLGQVMTSSCQKDL